MTVEPPLYAEIVAFWREAGPRRWFRGGAAFDEEIRARFETAHLAASRGELADWAQEAEGTLALLILTDQFPRNLYRGSAHAFATDAMARRVAARAVEAGFDQAVEPLLRPFFYLPFEHSEDADDQARAVALFEALARDAGDRDSLKWARIHQDIIARFGRFPHRNRAFGRTCTPEEAEFLANGGFGG
jgi:uncharacterized protein (DUF924 family)